VGTTRYYPYQSFARKNGRKDLEPDHVRNLRSIDQLVRRHRATALVVKSSAGWPKENKQLNGEKQQRFYVKGSRHSSLFSVLLRIYRGGEQLTFRVPEYYDQQDEMKNQRSEITITL